MLKGTSGTGHSDAVIRNLSPILPLALLFSGSLSLGDGKNNPAAQAHVLPVRQIL